MTNTSIVSRHVTVAASTSQNVRNFGTSAAQESMAMAAAEAKHCFSLMDLFHHLATSHGVFRHAIWGKLPTVFDVPSAAGLWKSADLFACVDWAERFGVNVYVSQAAKSAEGWSYPKLPTSLETIKRTLKTSTVIYQEAQMSYPAAARLALDFQHAFGLLANCNIYQTAAGIGQSSPAHTDHHDAFVVQTQGTKRWRVWGPPPLKPGAHPLVRGKRPDDQLELDELGPPVLDVVLRAGQVIYVPMGCTHLVETDPSASVSAEDSIHLTLSLDAHIFDLSYSRAYSLCCGNNLAAWLPDGVVGAGGFSDAQWASFAEILPLGFLDGTGGLAPQRVIAAELRRRIAALGPRSEGQLQNLPIDVTAEALAWLHQRLMEHYDHIFALAAQELPATAAQAKEREQTLQQMLEPPTRMRQASRDIIAKARDKIAHASVATGIVRASAPLVANMAVPISVATMAAPPVHAVTKTGAPTNIVTPMASPRYFAMATAVPAGVAEMAVSSADVATATGAPTGIATPRVAPANCTTPMAAPTVAAKATTEPNMFAMHSHQHREQGHVCQHEQLRLRGYLLQPDFQSPRRRCPPQVVKQIHQPGHQTPRQICCPPQAVKQTHQQGHQTPRQLCCPPASLNQLLHSPRQPLCPNFNQTPDYANQHPPQRVRGDAKGQHVYSQLQVQSQQPTILQTGSCYPVSNAAQPRLSTVTMSLAARLQRVSVA